MHVWRSSAHSLLLMKIQCRWSQSSTQTFGSWAVVTNGVRGCDDLIRFVSFSLWTETYIIPWPTVIVRPPEGCSSAFPGHRATLQHIIDTHNNITNDDETDDTPITDGVAAVAIMAELPTWDTQMKVNNHIHIPLIYMKIIVHFSDTQYLRH